MTQPLSMVMIADLTDPVQSGLAMGRRFTAIMLAGLLSPIFLGLIIETIDTVNYCIIRVVTE